MTPLAYRLHGHPVCLACFNDDYLLDDDDTARGWPARGDVPGCIRQAKAGPLERQRQAYPGPP